MKRILLAALVGAFSITAEVQAQAPQENTIGNKIKAHRAYRVFAISENDPYLIMARNDSLAQRGVRSRGAFFKDLGDAIAKSYGTTLVQKTTNATSNLISLGVSYLSSWIYKNRNEREAWLEIARRQCKFEQRLSNQIYIDDFYYEPSTSGALDPMDMKFKGFGCYGFLIPETDVKDKGTDLSEMNNDNNQLVEFYVSCKVRDDYVGLNHISNHSKFYVELDKLIFDTRHSSLPNDSSSGMEQKHFDFKGRKDLTFKLNVKVYSSWINEAIMLVDNQKIGEFNVVAKIDPEDLNENQIFVYDETKHSDKVSVTGDCFLVPRSYTGITGSPSWGTGQYRLEMKVSEECSVNEKWYQIPIKEVGNAQAIANRNTMGKVKWDKEKWQAEWHEMKTRKKGESVWNGVWKSVTTAYVGYDWVQELVSPLANAVNDQEGIKLNELLGLDTKAGAANAAASMPQGIIPSAGTK